MKQTTNKMENTKHITKGEVKSNIVKDSSPFNGMNVIHNEEEDFAYVEDYNNPYYDERKQANTELIVESFNVFNESGLTPRQLLEQRNELLEVMKEVEYNRYRNFDIPIWLLNKMQQAIKNANK